MCLSDRQHSGRSHANIRVLALLTGWVGIACDGAPAITGPGCGRDQTPRTMARRPARSTADLRWHRSHPARPRARRPPLPAGRPRASGSGGLQGSDTARRDTRTNLASPLSTVLSEDNALAFDSILYLDKKERKGRGIPCEPAMVALRSGLRGCGFLSICPDRKLHWMYQSYLGTDS